MADDARAPVEQQLGDSVRKTRPADVNRQARHDRVRDAVVKPK